MKINYPQQVNVIEVGPRDGLQAEHHVLSLPQKISWLGSLLDVGYPVIEIGSLVNPRLVPQMSDTDLLFEKIPHDTSSRLMVLVGNIHWLQKAIDIGVHQVSLLCSASETFAQKNIHRSIDESLRNISDMLSLAKQHDIFVRCYLSCSYDCPYEGQIAVKSSAHRIHQLLEMGCDQVAIADTTGRATPVVVEELLTQFDSDIRQQKLAVHFHDTYGQALANVVVSLQSGVTNVDSSIGGLGGCPYAPGAAGNLATQNLVYMLHGMGINTGIDEARLHACNDLVRNYLELPQGVTHGMVKL